VRATRVAVQGGEFPVKALDFVGCCVRLMGKSLTQQNLASLGYVPTHKPVSFRYCVLLSLPLKISAVLKNKNKNKNKDLRRNLTQDGV
jgi:hypothetical protein